jgi:hypothetical protein
VFFYSSTGFARTLGSNSINNGFDICAQEILAEIGTFLKYWISDFILFFPITDTIRDVDLLLFYYPLLHSRSSELLAIKKKGIF